MRNEEAILAGMEFGMDAYNERMGYDLSAPEPCGHHCSYDCPRCGDDASECADDVDDWEDQWYTDWEV
jgi:hypothetical protein